MRSSSQFSKMPSMPHAPLWNYAQEPVAYPQAVAAMEGHVQAMIEGKAGEKIWSLEHPPLYTAGVRAQESDILEETPFPIYKSARGGLTTYHGPGQRVIYPMLNLKARGKGLRPFVKNLEEWIITALASLGVKAKRQPDRIGIWVTRDDGSEEKIAFIGIRVRRWISFHGISLNVNPELNHFQTIVPCGIKNHRITSLADLGIEASMREVDDALQKAFFKIF